MLLHPHFHCNRCSVVLTANSLANNKDTCETMAATGITKLEQCKAWPDYVAYALSTGCIDQFCILTAAGVVCCEGGTGGQMFHVCQLPLISPSCNVNVLPTWTYSYFFTISSNAKLSANRFAWTLLLFMQIIVLS